tara:strand:- start:333 stop:776 length:444 start_codon:yes stop_codon:yes gene_type:complete
MRKLSTDEELELLKELSRDPERNFIYEQIKATYQVLHSRSQLLLSLATICLTITGFSGPRIAESGYWAGWMLIGGLSLVLMAAFFVLVGPLRIKWSTAYQAENNHETLKKWLRRRDFKTQMYRIAIITLTGGLTLYAAALICYLHSL